MRRELVEIPLGGLKALGTAHVPVGLVHDQVIVLLNAGHVPRCGHGGFAAHLADHLCGRGWAVLRVDLPGLGDAPGPLPERIETFWLDLKDGGHSFWAAQICRWAAQRFGVSRACLGGVCGAAITSVFTADRYPDAIDSLLLIEPELFTSEPPSAAEPAFPGASGGADAAEAARAAGRPAAPGPGWEDRERRADRWETLRKLGSSWAWMRLLSKRRDKVPLVGRLQRLILRLVWRGDNLPERANVALVEAWSRLSSRRLPMLVLTAEGLLWESYFLRLRRRILGPGKSRALHISVSGANHVFSNQAAQSAVQQAVPPWLESVFPAVHDPDFDTGRSARA